VVLFDRFEARPTKRPFASQRFHLALALREAAPSLTMIIVKPLAESFPGSYSAPGDRAAMLGHAGADYLTAVEYLRYKHMDVGPLFYVMLPTMFQTLELLCKAVALKANPAFNPQKDKHRVLKIVRDHAGLVPVFQEIVEHADAVQLFAALERAYIGVRYGECVVGYGAEDHDLFIQIADALLLQLSNLGFRWATPFWRAPQSS
jgi:hypothetical protein